MTPSELIQIILMGVLVVITGIYAWRTFAISKATKRQADASVEMAEEMKKQRYSESLPLLVPTIIPTWNTEGLDPNEVPYVYLQSGIGIKFMLRNLGKGVAIDSRFSLWCAPLDSSPVKVKFLPPRESEAFGDGDRKEIDFHDRQDGQLLDIPKEYHPRLEGEYQDIYERKITTVQEFRIEGKNEDKRAFVGDLYFMVNGKRLGEEVARHD